MTTRTTTVPLVEGIWTPWAAVLCGACHETHKPEYGPTVTLAPTTLGTHDALTTCDSCRRPIALDCVVAGEHNLMLALHRAEVPARMDQTGGMCSAVSVALGPQCDDGSDGDCLLIVDDETTEASDPPAFAIGYYAYGTLGYDEACEGVIVAEHLSEADSVRFVVDIVNRYGQGERAFAPQAQS
jgi:hypothetical protein